MMRDDANFQREPRKRTNYRQGGARFPIKYEHTIARDAPASGDRRVLRGRYGILRVSHDPTALATPTGNICQHRTSVWYFGLFGLTSGRVPRT